MNQKKGLRWWWWLAIILIPVLIVAAVFKAKSKPKGEEVDVYKRQEDKATSILWL